MSQTFSSKQWKKADKKGFYEENSSPWGGNSFKTWKSLDKKKQKFVNRFGGQVVGQKRGQLPEFVKAKNAQKKWSNSIRWAEKRKRANENIQWHDLPNVQEKKVVKVQFKGLGDCALGKFKKKTPQKSRKEQLFEKHRLQKKKFKAQEKVQKESLFVQKMKAKGKTHEKCGKCGNMTWTSFKGKKSKIKCYACQKK